MRRFRNIKGTDAVKAFTKAGGVVRQGKGDHVNIKMPNGQLITIPVSSRAIILIIQGELLS